MEYKTTKDFIEFFKEINQDSKNFSKEELDVFIFCFLLIGYLEKMIEKTLYTVLLKSQLPELRYPGLINFVTKEMTFGTKINIFEFTIKGCGEDFREDFKKFIKFYREINYGIRNNLFHFKIDELKYKNQDVRKIEIQAKIMKDFNLVMSEVLKGIESWKKKHKAK